MNKLIIIVLFFCFFSLSLSGQKVFIVETPGTVNNYKFNINDKIKIKTKNDKKPFKAVIKDIKDSSLIINKFNNTLFLNDIEIVYKENKGVSILSKILIPIGLIFAPLDIVNNLINKDKPVVREMALIVSGISLSAGLLISLDTYKKCKIDNKKWRLKIIDKTGAIK